MGLRAGEDKSFDQGLQMFLGGLLFRTAFQTFSDILTGAFSKFCPEKIPFVWKVI